MIGSQITRLEDPHDQPGGRCEAIKLSVEKNWEWTRLIVETLAGLFTRETSVKQLMGPVAIADLSGAAAQAGWISLFSLMAMISLNLGLLNLMPIPVLDGGHIFILALEGLARRDFSMRVKEKMLLVGFVAPADADGHRHLQRPDAHPMDRKTRPLALAPLSPLVLMPSRVLAPRAQEPDPLGTGTFSILGYDPATGELGAAVQSRVFAVGNGVLWAEADVGIAATQAIVDVSYGPKALALLRAGMKPDAIVKAILDSDPDPGYGGQPWPKAGPAVRGDGSEGQLRRAHRARRPPTWAGNKGGKFCTAQGNILAGEAVVTNMVKAFEETHGRAVAPAGGRARGGPGRRRRHARPAVGRADHRQEELRRVAEQRHRAAAAG